MNLLVSIILLAVGVALLVAGFASADSLGSRLSHFFTGSPTDKTIWLLIAGAICAAIGLGNVMRSKRE